MHVLFRESQGLEEADIPRDLGQPPADLVVLSFSDSDLGAFAEGWRRGRADLPALRLANLAMLRHPLSVDTYIDRTLSGARGILIRLIGGAPYWRYGLEQVERLARDRGIALAVLSGEGDADPRLDAASTLPVSTLRRLSALCVEGGAVAAQAALAQMALAAGLYAGPVPGEKTLPAFGLWDPEQGVLRTDPGAEGASWAGPTPPAPSGLPRTRPEEPEARAPDSTPPVTAPPGRPDEPEAGPAPLILLTFYRAWLAAADTAPIAALMAAFRAAGCEVQAAFVPSLKDPATAAWLSDLIPRLRPAAIVNATAFSARGPAGSPLDTGGVPVFQVVHATAARGDWAGAERGLSPADLAMHVVLPEIDGRIAAGVVSFKETAAPDPDLHFARAAHAPDPDRIRAVVARVLGWIRLAQRPVALRRVAMILSTYPGKDWQMAHAVGLDALASAQAILTDLSAAGYAVTGDLTALGGAEIAWPLSAYDPAEEITARWGTPEEDPGVRDGAFRFRALRLGHVLVALQPERGRVAARAEEYHDTALPPRHAYAAFYQWLRADGVDALLHLGAHGTLEWLPGKAVALSSDCWPERLTGPVPVIYPFIVNDPGEAAQARRRIGAVTLGHLTPPLVPGALPEGLARLETLLDEYSTAGGLDPARQARLIARIREEAQALGVEADLGLPAGATPVEALTRIDRFVCDVKDSQFGEGLHIWGRAPEGADASTQASAAAERAALIAALDGRRIEPGPSGSPWRGRADVLPTGRNLTATDPRALPSRAAHAQGVRMAEEVLRRHLQDHGDWPRGLVVELWGSATMRTAGEDFAMALHLAGAAPVWDEGSDRVSGVEILPLALLDRPRIEVTLRVSGLFRDVFPGLAGLFEQAAAMLAARDEAADMNPYVAALPGPRVFSPAPGQYGLGIGDLVEDYGARDAAGLAWLAASAHGADGSPARDVLEARLRGADGFVHAQDLPETDLLLAADYALHEGGFAAAMAVLGAPAPALYHLDATRPGDPRARTLPEEIARVLRARATSPVWLSGMMRHGFRGGAEIAATLEHLAAFAHLAGGLPPHLFDLYHEAVLGDQQVRDFLARENPGALAAIEARFAALREAGLWITRRNSIAAGLA